MDPPSEVILKTRVDIVDAAAAGWLVAAWAREGAGRMVCALNVHMAMEAVDDPAFESVINGADLVVADGRPIVWACKSLGRRNAVQVRGFDLMIRLCAIAQREGLRVGLYGGSPATVREVSSRLLRVYPGLDLVHSIAPPFRALTPQEDAHDVHQIREAGVQLLFVALGCPKQERWMALHRSELGCTSVGVGAAFDMLTGHHRPAPRWLQPIGLEWAYRLAQEPRRLWSRYAKHNSRFVLYFAAQWARHRRGDVRPHRDGSA